MLIYLIFNSSTLSKLLFYFSASNDYFPATHLSRKCYIDSESISFWVSVIVSSPAKLEYMSFVAFLFTEENNMNVCQIC
mgnify:CR=1 FL=1